MQSGKDVINFLNITRCHISVPHPHRDVGGQGGPNMFFARLVRFGSVFGNCYSIEDRYLGSRSHQPPGFSGDIVLRTTVPFRLSSLQHVLFAACECGCVCGWWQVAMR